MIEDFKRIIFGDEFDEISISKLRNIKILFYLKVYISICH